MRWRRGLILAGINLVATVPLILNLESQDVHWLHDHDASVTIAARESAKKEVAPNRTIQPEFAQQVDAVAFNLCSGIFEYPAQEYLVRLGNMPAAALTGWRFVCPSEWMLSGRLGAFSWTPTTATISAQKHVDICLCILLVIQWFFVGAFPLKQPKNWWHGSGTLITACMVIGAIFSFSNSLSWFVKPLALIAGITWFCWFVLILWSGTKTILRLVATRFASQQ